MSIMSDVANFYRRLSYNEQIAWAIISSKIFLWRYADYKPSEELNFDFLYLKLKEERIVMTSSEFVLLLMTNLAEIINELE
ncbi:MAG: hypothetical protein WCJ33_08085, partial [Pseudomonadota bacterium]